MFDDLTPPYHTIVADPPWPYDGKGQPGTGGRGKAGVRAMPTPSFTHHYDSMTMKDLRDLPVGVLAHKDAHLYVWTTNAFMIEAHELARAWGFTPKTILTWGKVKKDDPNSASMKTGYYFRGATEHVVFATRGSLPKPKVAIPTLCLWPRIGQHSRKPDEFFGIVEQISPGPYLELFARQNREGWSSWGNQVHDVSERVVVELDDDDGDDDLRAAHERIADLEARKKRLLSVVKTLGARRSLSA